MAPAQLDTQLFGGVHQSEQLEPRAEDDVSPGATAGIVLGIVLGPFALIFILACFSVCVQCCCDIGRDYKIQRRVTREALEERRKAMIPPPRRAARLEEMEMVASIPHLPDEILLSILSHVHQGGKQHIQSCAEFCVAQQDLADASLTCKVWHRICSQLLYCRPRLRSDGSLTRFARTVSSNPDLARLVRDLVMLQPARSRGMSSATKECVVSCTQVTSLTLGKQVNSRGYFISPRADSKLYAKLAVGRLTTLTITDSDAPWAKAATDAVRLPALEVLLLRRVAFPPSYVFPVLPRLHTLSIIRAKMQENQKLPMIPENERILDVAATSFPSLRTLNVHEVVLAIRLCPKLIRGLEGLTYLDLYARRQEAFFKTNATIWDKASNLRCLTTVVPSKMFPPSADLFPKLETLMVIVPARDFMESNLARESKEFITGLSGFLRASRMALLKEIIVVVDWAMPSPLSGSSSPIPSLIRQCVSRRVDVDVLLMSILTWVPEVVPLDSRPGDYKTNELEPSEVMLNTLQSR